MVAGMDTGDAPVRVGVSACLLGAKVRYDGADRRAAFLVEGVGRSVEWVPVCPEVETGMGVPRETVRLVRAPTGATLMRGTESDTDWTARMTAFAARRVRALRLARLDGYVFKARSPSCGLVGVPLVVNGRVRTQGVGLFAAALVAEDDLLPVAEDEDLADARAQVAFLARVVARARLRTLRRQWCTRAVIERAHAHELWRLRAHRTRGVNTVDDLVVDSAEPLSVRYASAVLRVLATPPTDARHAAVLRSALRALKPTLPRAERQTCARVVDSACEGRAPLLAAIDHLRGLAHATGCAAVLAQTYLNPHPAERAALGRLRLFR